MNKKISIIAFLSFIFCAFSPVKAALLTFSFEAVNQSPLSIFEVGDTITGQFTLDDSLEEQNSPIASINYLYTDVSTGETASGSIDDSVNASPDLIVINASNGIDSSYNFYNLTTEPNIVFGAGIFFDEIFIRFANGLPTYVTMTILLGGPNGQAYGPNFTLTSVERVSVSDVPVPAAFPLFLAGLGSLFSAVSRRHAKRKA